jgi:hypothetical protein
MRDTALATKGTSMSWEVEQIGSCTLYRGDAYTIVPTLQGVHALITDPPYGIKFDWLNASRARPTASRRRSRSAGTPISWATRRPLIRSPGSCIRRSFCGGCVFHGKAATDSR